MYNLIMGAVEGSLGADRMLEGVDADLDDFLRPGGVLNTEHLMDLPTLMMPEIGENGSLRTPAYPHV